MEKLDIFQSRLGKICKFCWWDLERVSVDAGTLFTSMEFQDKCQTGSVHLTLSAPELQEMNGQVKVTWITLRTIAHSILVYARFLEVYINLCSIP